MNVNGTQHSNAWKIVLSHFDINLNSENISHPTMQLQIQKHNTHKNKYYYKKQTKK